MCQGWEEQEVGRVPGDGDRRETETVAIRFAEFSSLPMSNISHSLYFFSAMLIEDNVKWETILVGHAGTTPIDEPSGAEMTNRPSSESALPS